ncbi:MAG: peptidoglycan DD-metalloendopeptidase family protein [Promicromonosporaceae bacterium]|nr:peptidoglycan DD-metalloendopeptidase family protein [Promicromonosporaceae bacterium]
MRPQNLLTAALRAAVLVPVLSLPLVGPVAARAALSDVRVATGYVAPVPGPVARPFDPPATQRDAGHRGVDLWAGRGGVVGSPGPGVVTFAGQVAGKSVVVVTHPDGLRSSLEPVDANVPVGTAVAAGDPVGVLAAAPGDGANPDHCAALVPPDAGEACVHWGVRRGDVYLDPLTLLHASAPIVLLPPPAAVPAGS